MANVVGKGSKRPGKAGRGILGGSVKKKLAGREFATGRLASYAAVSSASGPAAVAGNHAVAEEQNHRPDNRQDDRADVEVIDAVADSERD